MELIIGFVDLFIYYILGMFLLASILYMFQDK